jgi:malate synthase
MTVPFMRAYTELLVRTCHRRGAHAMGGMAAFVPSRRDAEVNETALAKVREDKEREAGSGFDGTWVAHPDLVPAATEVFDSVFGDRPNQVDRQREDVSVEARDLLDVTVPGGEITEAGIGAVAIYNLMEDAATAEISRSQIWQWVRNGKFDERAVHAVEEAELERLRDGGRWDDAREVFEQVALGEDFAEFLTLPAYDHLD